MARRSTLDVLKHLDRSSCGECGLPTCLAFAVAVSGGSKRPEDCPRLSPEAVAELGGLVVEELASAPDPAEGLAPLRDRVARLDLERTAARLGGAVVGDRLSFHVLGRVFEIDRAGELHSDCHVNRWVHLPLLSHVLSDTDRRPTGDWVPFAELRGAVSWTPFFAHKCEGPFQALAEAHGDLLVDLLVVFGGRPLAEGATADPSLVLRPMPTVPLLFNYWPEGEGFPPRLTLLFDRSAEDLLGPEAAYYLSHGLVEMLKRLCARHGRPEP